MRKPFRIDPRLLIGVFLVIASVVGVFVVVDATRATVTRVVAVEAIAPGETIRADQVRSVEVNLGDHADEYAAAEQLKSESGLVATKPIAPGELIPVSALGDADTSRAAMVVPIAGQLPSSVVVGAQVEVWAAVPGERPGTYAPPNVIVSDATVVRVVEGDDFVVSDDVEVELLVPDSDTATVLSATAAQARIQLVPKYQPVDTQQEG